MKRPIRTGAIEQLLDLISLTDRVVMHGYKVVGHVIWPALNEVPMGLCACQAILFDRLMRSSDHLIPRHERMLSA